MLGKDDYSRQNRADFRIDFETSVSFLENKILVVSWKELLLGWWFTVEISLIILERIIFFIQAFISSLYFTTELYICVLRKCKALFIYCSSVQ